MPFCAGQKHFCIKKDNARAIAGRVTIIQDPKAQLFSLKVSARRITVGALAYLMFGGTIRNMLGPVADFGMKNPMLQIDKQGALLKILGHGRFSIASGKCRGAIMCLLEGAVSFLTIQPSLEMVNGEKKLELAIKLPRMMLKKHLIYIQDEMDDGPSVFVSLARKDGVTETTMGIRLPLKICVENCKPKKGEELKQASFTGSDQALLQEGRGSSGAAQQDSYRLGFAEGLKSGQTASGKLALEKMLKENIEVVPTSFLHGFAAGKESSEAKAKAKADDRTSEAKRAFEKSEKKTTTHSATATPKSEDDEKKKASKAVVPKTPLNVKSGARYLIFTGELAVSASPTQTVVTGKISMTGFWFNALGLKMLHISHLSALVGVDLKIMLPTKIEVSAIVCLGARKTCETGQGNNFIRGGAFVGVDATDPSDLYFMGMISELSINKIFKVMGDTISPKFHQWLAALPPPLRETGIYPLKKCSAKDMTNPTRKQCFAMISFSPASARAISTTHGTVSIDRGMVLAGRLNLLGWNLSVHASVKTDFPPHFYVNAKADPMNIAGIIKLGRSRDQMKLGPRVYIDLGYSSPMAAAVYIKGCFKIPPLLTSGLVTIFLDNKGFRFLANSVVLGIARSEYKIVWTYDFKNIVVQGKFMLKASGGVAAKLVGGIVKMLRNVFNAAITVVTKVADRLPDLRADFLTELRKVKDICKSFNKFKPASWACKKAFDIGLMAAGKVGDFGVAFLNGFVKLIKAMPKVSLEGMGVSAGKLMGRVGRAVSAQFKKLLDLQSFLYRIQMDNGNMVAEIKIALKALGKQHKLNWKLRINIGALVKKIWEATMGRFITFAKDMGKKALGKFDEARKKVTGALKSLAGTLETSMKKAANAVLGGIKKAAKAVQYAAKKAMQAAKYAAKKALHAARAARNLAKRAFNGVKKGFKKAGKAFKKVFKGFRV